MTSPPPPRISPPRPAGARRPSLAQRASGVTFTITALIGLALGTFVLRKLAEYGSNPRTSGAVDASKIPGIVRRLIEHRAYYMILCLPALAGGLLVLVGARPRGLWYTLALLGILAMFGVLLTCFIAWIAPLYQYQDL